LFKPKDEHDVRLFKNPHGSESLNEVFFHGDLGTPDPIPCPKMNRGDECAICDFAAALAAWKTPEGKDKSEAERKQDFEIFKKIQAKARVYVPCVERGKEAEGGKWWSMTTAQAGQALDVCAEVDRQKAVGVDKDNALDVVLGVEKAYDIHVSFAKPGTKGNSKSITIVTLKGKLTPGPLGASQAETNKILETLPKLSEVVTQPSSEEVARILKKFMGGNATTTANVDSGADYAESKSAAPKNSKENAKLVGTKSIDEAFNSMVENE
jgi:hypothetical protein